MKVGDLVLIVSLGEIKAYRANPRTPEAEVGLKPEEFKLDLATSIDILDAHKKLQDLVTDVRGEFKAGFLKRVHSGEKHNLEAEIYKSVIKVLAEEIDRLTQNEKRVFLAIPAHIANDVLENVKNQDKIFKVVKKDLIKMDKNEIVESFK